MDDNTMPDKATVNYVENAVEAALKGDKLETAETAPRGCAIRWTRVRK